MDQLFDEWVDWGTPMEHLASWWSRRGEPFVLLVHYADLLADLDGEMRRIADFLDVDVPATLWDDAVKRCEFEAMKSGHRSVFFTLEYTQRDVLDRFRAIGVEPAQFDRLFEFDASDAISADYIVRMLGSALE